MRHIVFCKSIRATKDTLDAQVCRSKKFFSCTDLVLMLFIWFLPKVIVWMWKKLFVRGSFLFSERFFLHRAKRSINETTIKITENWRYSSFAIFLYSAFNQICNAKCIGILFCYIISAFCSLWNILNENLCRTMANP